MQLAWALALAVACVAVCTDVKERRIPNRLTWPALAAGLLVNGWAAGWSGLTFSLFGILLGFLLLFLFFLRGGIGGGDVKLMMALGAICGPGFLFHSFLYTALAGAVISMGVLIRRNRWRPALTGVTAAGEARTGLSIPYAVPILIGVLLETGRRTFGWL